MKNIYLLFASAITLLVLLAIFSPEAAHLPLYLVVFVLIYIFYVALIAAFLQLAYAQLSKGRRMYTALIIGFSPTILMALASLSTLSLLDVILALGVPTLVVWYGVRTGTIK